MGAAVLLATYRRRPQPICWVCALVWLVLMPLSSVLGWYGLWRALLAAWHSVR